MKKAVYKQEFSHYVCGDCGQSYIGRDLVEDIPYINYCEKCGSAFNENNYNDFTKNLLLVTINFSNSNNIKYENVISFDVNLKAECGWYVRIVEWCYNRKMKLYYTIRNLPSEVRSERMPKK